MPNVAQNRRQKLWETRMPILCMYTYRRVSMQLAVVHVSCTTSSISLSPSMLGGGAGASSPWYTNTNCIQGHTGVNLGAGL